VSTYVFDQSWQRERERLSALESLFDDASRRLLNGLGLQEGWRCLEVGCGAGGIATWLADRVGSTGRVLATDLDTRFLDGHGRANLEVRTHDVISDPLEPDTFDVVHARAVLEHLPARDEVLRGLVGAVKPGGWLLIEDVDVEGPAAVLLAQYLSDSHARPGMERLIQAVAALFTAAGAHPSYGRRLPSALAGACLVNVAAEIHTPVVSGGTENWTRGTIQQLRDRLIGKGGVTQEDIDVLLATSAQPATRYAPAFMVSAWGQRPLS
jgi:2-polyprenyl-3-methyl-5-hydroxy-6-metoxy-1,4-benzoquinol methylase